MNVFLELLACHVFTWMISLFMKSLSLLHQGQVCIGAFPDLCTLQKQHFFSWQSLQGQWRGWTVDKPSVPFTPCISVLIQYNYKLPVLPNFWYSRIFVTASDSGSSQTVKAWGFFFKNCISNNRIKEGVLVFCCCYKLPPTRGLKQHRFVILKFYRSESQCVSLG